MQDGAAGLQDGVPIGWYGREWADSGGRCGSGATSECPMSLRHKMAKVSACCGLALLAGCVEDWPNRAHVGGQLVNGFPVAAPPVPGHRPQSYRATQARAAAPATAAAGRSAATPERTGAAEGAAEPSPPGEGQTEAATAEPAGAQPGAEPAVPESAQVSAVAPPQEPQPRGGPAPLATASLSRMVGFDQSEVLQLLGRPGSDEDVPPARMWRYGSANCQLRVYFYMEMQTRNFRVLSYDLTSRDHGADAEQHCLSEFTSQAAPRSP